MTAHYIHRPTPEGGETDDRFRELTREVLMTEGAEFYLGKEWVPVHVYDELRWLTLGTIWRIPGSDAPSAETLRLARETR